LFEGRARGEVEVNGERGEHGGGRQGNRQTGNVQVNVIFSFYSVSSSSFG
jgi:hypothetical protein